MESLEIRCVLDSTVVFNELMYHPAGDDEQLEWIELHNQMAVDMNLSGWSLADAVSYTFPQGTIVPGGGYLVVAADPQHLLAEQGVTDTFGPYERRLSNGGETIELRNHTGRLMDRLVYDDEGDWPLAADGSGATLAKRYAQAASEPAANWTFSSQLGGSPGVANPSENLRTRDDLVVNEVAAVTSEAFFLEIHNPTDSVKSLEGFQLVRERDMIAASIGATSLAANDFLVIQQAEIPFELVAGDRVLLFDSANMRLIDTVEVKESNQARSAQHEYRWQVPLALTPGTPNSFAFNDQIVINEIMYQASPTYAQPGVFGADPVLDLDATWRLDQSGVDLGTEWREPGFDDSQWPSGQGLFYIETSDLPGPKNTPLEFGLTTYYFRTTFDWTTDASAPLQFRHVVDDGAVFYINGVEFGRFNMAGGDVNYDTISSVSVGDASLVGPLTIPAELLVDGTNTLAVELHQRSAFSPDVVFGAELYTDRQIVAPTPFVESDEEWIELYNRGDTAVDVSGWQLNDAVDFQFPSGVIIGPNEYVIVARDAESMAEQYPEIRIAGEFSGRLADSNERIQLLDAHGNLADEVHYYDGGQWPEYADAGGSSLELRDPDADNSQGGAWASSNESSRSEWTHVSYTMTVDSIVYDPPINFHEFVMGLTGAGEILIDNISVVETPDGEAAELIQNGSFESDTPGTQAEHWRLVGTHKTSEVIADPDQPGNQVLRLVAESRMNYLSNHAETTLANNARVRDGMTYRISYDAKWINGSPQLHTELYYKDAARTTILPQPEMSGTPGAQNSTYQQNIGPTFSALRHDPPIPSPTDSVTVQVTAADPDGLGSINLYYAIDGRGDFATVAMTDNGDGTFSAVIPPQDNGDVVQFYVQASDSHGIASFFPAAGPESRALYKVTNTVNLDEDRHDFRIVMTPQDVSELHLRTNMVDNARFGSTVIYNATEIFYDVGTRLKGSMFSRQNRATTGYNLRFAPDQLFRGVHDTVRFDQNGESEIVVKYFAAAIGNLGGSYDDVFELTTPSGSGGGPTLTFLAAHDNLFLSEQFENGDEGTLFKFEGIRVMQTTVDGDPESLKLYQPIGWVPQFDIQDLGNDKELYRWPYLIHNNRDRDNYDPIIALAKTFSLVGDALEQEAQAILDVDQWTSTFALMSLFGIGDAYSQGNPHNLNIYQRPSDGKLLAFPWDWDFVFSQPTTAPLHGNKNIGKLLDLPSFEHAFLGQLHHMITTQFNRQEMQHWTDNFGSLLRMSLSGVLTNIERRGQYVLTQLPPEEFFQVGTNSITVESTSLVNDSSSAKFLVPQPSNGGDQLGTAWTLPSFEVSDAWETVPAAVGFETTPSTFEPFIKHDAIAMHGVNSSAYLRIPFQLNEADLNADRLTLRMKVDDGFVAYLNGVQIASKNPPATLEWDSSAQSSVRNSDAIEFIDFDVTAFIDTLQPGQNVLAIHGLNRSTSSSDFLLVPELNLDNLVQAPPEEITVDTTSVTLQGTGWIDVHEIRLAGSDQPLDVDWNETTRWEVTLPLDPGENQLVLEAYNLSGQRIGASRIHVTSTALRPAREFLRVSELMYHAPDPSADEIAAGFADDDDFDYLELVNTSTTESIDLAQVRLQGGVDFAFSSQGPTLGPGETVVIAANPAALSLRYDIPTSVHGPFAGRLSNAGETVELIDAVGSVIVAIPYSDDAPWPEAADGAGSSLVPVSLSLARGDYELPTSWRASAPSPGAIRTADADFTGDGVIDVDDLNLMCAAIQGLVDGDLNRFDLDGNGDVDLLDHAVLVEQVLGTSYGDANLDGTFNSGDLVQVFQFGQYEDGIVGNSTWAAGDWNCDGEFTSSDLVVAFQRGSYVAASRPAFNANRSVAARDQLFAQWPGRGGPFMA